MMIKTEIGNISNVNILADVKQSISEKEQTIGKGITEINIQDKNQR